MADITTERGYLDRLAELLPKLSKEKRDYILAYAEGMAMADELAKED